jgi:hypothetical protein
VQWLLMAIFKIIRHFSDVVFSIGVISETVFDSVENAIDTGQEGEAQE